MADDSALLSTVTRVFESEDWAFARVEGREVLRAGFEAHHTRVDLHVQVFPELGAVSVVSESPLPAGDPARRERFAELVMRTNETLTIGGFEMRWEPGTVVFRVTNLFPTPQGEEKIITGLVVTTISEMDRIAPLLAILSRVDGADLAGMDLPTLMDRDDLLPEVDGNKG